MITDKQCFDDLRAYILSVVPGFEVVRGEKNNVPMPSGRFILMTPSRKLRLATNQSHYSDPTPTTGTHGFQQNTQFAIRLDCYGAGSSEASQQLTTLLRSEHACDNLQVLTPLYADDPIQLPLVTGEQQYEERWTIEAQFQYNPVVTVPQQFADTLGPVNTNPVEV